LKTFYIAEYFYAVSAAIIKCSISVTLLRIATSQRRYKWPIYTIIGLTWVAAIVFCAGIASICASLAYPRYNKTRG
jgi:tetrahydromethanopterin S-methyltransferase subunit E